MLLPAAGHVWMAIIAVVASGAWLAAVAQPGQPVRRIGDRWLSVPSEAGAVRVPYFGSGDLATPQPMVSRAVVILNGTLRNADDYYASGVAAAKSAGADLRRVFILAPQFLATPDVEAVSAADDVPLWSLDGWKDGARALRPQHGPSSFTVLDMILQALLDRRRFPSLGVVVVAGHSAGGQVVQRYAATSRADAEVRSAGITLRYVVANPSTYLYFDDRRVTAEGGLAAFPRASCPSFNRYKYGLEDANEYVGSPDGLALARRYAQRDVTYLLGEEDTNPRAPYLDTTCAAAAQGASRRERGERYVRYLQLLLGAEIGQRHRHYIVPGVGHDHAGIFGSPCGLRQLYGDGRC
jgi:pimeloyl-ACP methyl ester carboxylesterase